MAQISYRSGYEYCCPHWNIIEGNTVYPLMKWALKLSQNCEMWYHAVWLICTYLVKCDTKQCWYILILCNVMLWLICTDLTEDLLLQVWGRSSTLITQATCSSEIYLHIYQTTWCHSPRRHLHVDKVLLMLLVTTEKYSFKLEDFFQTTVLWGYAVAQLVEELCYKLEGRGFDSQWGSWDF